MLKTRITALVVLILAFGLGYFVYKSEIRSASYATAVAQPVTKDTIAPKKNFMNSHGFKLGLDLKGGSHLVYQADVSTVKGDVGEAMASLRDVIERRVNALGLSEPMVTVENAGFTNGGEHRLIVDLPGVTDINQAIKQIGETPVLEFKIKNPNPAPQKVTVGKDGVANISVDQSNEWVATGLTGAYLDHTAVEFDATTNEPKVSLVFNKEGAALFEKITGENIGKQVAIFLDGGIISAPNVNEKITGGSAVISGNFTPKAAKDLSDRLNFGALPVSVNLVSTQTIGASLGTNAVHAGVKAGIVGFLLVALFLIFWYRLPGIIAVLSLSVYVLIVLTIFKIIPVTLTAAGIAGFIISIGTAVDANILIFERMKEELRRGKDLPSAIRAGYDRAWTSIRDANISSLITGVILYSFGTVLIKGFALTLIIGMLVALFSAITISRLFIYALSIKHQNKIVSFLFGSGFRITKSSNTAN